MYYAHKYLRPILSTAKVTVDPTKFVLAREGGLTAELKLLLDKCSMHINISDHS